MARSATMTTRREERRRAAVPAASPDPVPAGLRARGRVRIRRRLTLSSPLRRRDSARGRPDVGQHVDPTTLRPRVSQADHQNRSLRRHRHQQLSNGATGRWKPDAAACRVDLRDSYMAETAFGRHLPRRCGCIIPEPVGQVVFGIDHRRQHAPSILELGSPPTGCFGSLDNDGQIERQGNRT